ncbi:Multifunctional cyclase-dehydratase-3-O-methyl transferase TcmN [Photorhabdus australis subsp. thailandensis]|uniref:Multifunctional cyclase-dehydratase-3-O-methyl transferase TcmN n=1 Tax=Photorhabdus australis subsp. thailandensis TaxID=2805096 RepID=A0A1C0U975_9GAMM|nr:methyltransferase [Photorhabdus australis]OCQ54467.1 Multifunctional cyclase-dehydratase-3-O-methyl transferase TcmN [Photorhabdus australis subsp. thailandensis]
MIVDLIIPYKKSAAVYAFINTGLSVHFKNGVYVDIDELSRKCNINNSRLSRLCDFLIEVGILVGNNRKVALYDKYSALADPESIELLMIKWVLSPDCWNAWSMYSKSLLEDNGKSAFEITHGKPFFEYLNSNKLLRSNFDASMSKTSDKIVKKLLDIYNFSKHNRILDVGGGEGNLLIKISEKVKGKHYTVLDKYNEIPVSENIDFIDGDFLKSIPSGYDLHILKHIIHNWSDDDSILILENCRKAIDNNATILLIGFVKKPGSRIVNSLDILMDVILSGKERTLEEFEYLANQAGLAIRDTKDIDEDHAIIELGIK